MKPNADCTVFTQKYNPEARKKDWVAIFIKGVYWQGSTGSRLSKLGTMENNETIVFIPFSSFPNLVIKPEDKIVRGATDAKTPVGLKDALTVMGVDTFDYGSPDMQHREVVAK